MGNGRTKEKNKASTAVEVHLPREIVLADIIQKSSIIHVKRNDEKHSERYDGVQYDSFSEGGNKIIDDDSLSGASLLDVSEKWTTPKPYLQVVPNSSITDFNLMKRNIKSPDSIATAPLTPDFDSVIECRSVSTDTDKSSIILHTLTHDKSEDESSDRESSFIPTDKDCLPRCSNLDVSFARSTKCAERCKNLDGQFATFRMNYLIVHIAIMLADGLQGTHLYVLYEGYGYSVATLYSLGFISGAITSPFIGPLVDRIGRKKAAITYCILEIIVNSMEQYPFFIGLIFSQVIGGMTLNLLFSVFESWLVTEHRKLGFSEDKLETILRDSTIVSNIAAVASGYVAHHLASMLGPVGPFKGAVSFTWCAVLLISMLWTENYGSESSEVVSVRDHMVGAFKTILSDSKISRIGLIQGLTEGSLQTFVFLWSPVLKNFSYSALPDTICLDKDGEPAYGLIFGGFMACGVIGGVLEPAMRKIGKSVTGALMGTKLKDNGSPTEVGQLCVVCYLLSAILLLTPCLVASDSPYSFSVCLAAFMLYEILVGVYMPCEGVLRSIFIPNKSTCSLMTMLRVIVNVSVALGVISTNYIAFTTAFYAISATMMVAACLQMSLIPGV